MFTIYLMSMLTLLLLLNKFQLLDFEILVLAETWLLESLNSMEMAKNHLECHLALETTLAVTHVL